MEVSAVSASDGKGTSAVTTAALRRELDESNDRPTQITYFILFITLTALTPTAMRN